MATGVLGKASVLLSSSSRLGSIRPPPPDDQAQLPGPTQWAMHSRKARLRAGSTAADDQALLCLLPEAAPLSIPRPGERTIPAPGREPAGGLLERGLDHDQRVDLVEHLVQALERDLDVGVAPRGPLPVLAAPAQQAAGQDRHDL